MKTKNGYGQYWTHYERYRMILIVRAYHLPHTGHSSISYAPYGTKMTDFSSENGFLVEQKSVCSGKLYLLFAIMVSNFENSKRIY